MYSARALGAICVIRFEQKDISPQLSLTFANGSWGYVAVLEKMPFQAPQPFRLISYFLSTVYRTDCRREERSRVNMHVHGSNPLCLRPHISQSAYSALPFIIYFSVLLLHKVYSLLQQHNVHVTMK